MTEFTVTLEYVVQGGAGGRELVQVDLDLICPTLWLTVTDHQLHPVERQGRVHGNTGVQGGAVDRELV